MELTTLDKLICMARFSELRMFNDRKCFIKPFQRPKLFLI